MDFTDIVDDIQMSILTLQRRLDELRTMDDRLAQTVMLTRQEAAAFVGESLRQFDRDCHRYGIQKIYTVNGVRIRKSDLMLHMGLFSEPVIGVQQNNTTGMAAPQTEFEKILSRTNRQ